MRLYTSKEGGGGCGKRGGNERRGHGHNDQNTGWEEGGG